ncbi:uncharacterized protein LOC122257069 isoform X2 [Penaeus japonicus]|uniref:uncharacterized protein LOC122257069 isoform X2 n=1 Tax=Penaeus japonicus TaxID=27405 RepID=UPI001C713583|nr:uncharacterized protein LOC122257069 isoform X2 [Penaeus japonicus]
MFISSLLKLHHRRYPVPKAMRELSSSLTILTVTFWCIGITNGEYGAKCIKSSDCHYDEVCKNDHCNCSNIIYSEKLVPECKIWKSYDLCMNDEQCWANSKCVGVRCKCKEGYYRIESSCRKVRLQGLMQSCRIQGSTTWLCDVNKHTVCINAVCICTGGYVPNLNGTCESKGSYIRRHGLLEYRVKPGEYCRASTDCIDGLLCEDLKCRCPSFCYYDRRKEICDCGGVEKESGPIFLGIILGLIIISFWYCTIKKTIKKHKKKMNQFSTIPVVNNEYAAPSYPLSPVQSSIQTETTVDGTASPVSRTAGTPIPENTGTSGTHSINPPQNPSYPIHPKSDNPPSYEEVISSTLYNPDAASQPLTFVPNAPYPHAYIPLSSDTKRASSPTHTLSGRPYSRSSSPVPSATPYPLNPMVTPYPDSSDATQDSVNSSAPAGAMSPSSPLSSVPVAPPAYNPYFHEGGDQGSAESDIKPK